jgi:RNA polymerase sigma factor (sigma-70 family)
MDDQVEFQALMDRVRAGSEEAATELFRRYGSHIVQVVRRKLLRRLRAKYDSQDFTQAVWASFFTAPAHELVFDRPEKLVGYLAAMAEHKVIEVTHKRNAAQKRDIDRECSLDGSAAVQVQHMYADDPRPSQIVMLEEEWQHLLESLRPRQRHILTMLRQGKKRKEIAAEIGVDERTVRRVLDIMLARLDLKVAWTVPSAPDQERGPEA